MTAKQNLLVFQLVTSLFWFSMFTYVPLLSTYIHVLHGSTFITGVIIGLYGFTQMLIRIPLGIWADRVLRRKPFIIAGLVLATFSSLGLALTHSIPWLLVFRAISGIAAGFWVIFTVLNAAYYESREVTKAMGIISFLTSAGQFVAFIIGGIVAQRYGWHAAFWVGFIGGMIGWIGSLGIKEIPKPPSSRKIHQKEWRSLLQYRLLWRMSFLAVFAQAVTFSTMFGFTPSAAASLGASKAELSWLTLATIFPNALASLYSGGLLSRKLGTRNVILIGFLMSFLFTGIIPMVHSLSWLFVTQIVNGFGQGLCMPMLMGLAIRDVAPDQRATAMGIYQAVYALGMFGGPFLAGGVGNLINLNASFYTVSIISLMAMILTYRWTPNEDILFLT